jgi:hypothetical protein
VSDVPRAKYVVIHCPEGRPGPYEVIGVDDAPLARFETLDAAQEFAAREAAKVGAKVILSPLEPGAHVTTKSPHENKVHTATRRL